MRHSASPRGAPNDLRLIDASRVGVIGGGPAGSFFSYFLLRPPWRETRLRVAGEGEFIGEMPVCERELRSATVRALGEARVLTIHRMNFLPRINEDPSLAFHLVETMSHPIRELSAEIVNLKATIRKRGVE